MTITVRNFRVLLIASLLVAILGGTIDLVFPDLLAEAFHQAMEAEALAISMPRVFLLGALGVVLLITTLAAYYGLYMLRPWAPKLSLLITVLALPFVALAGAAAQSGYAAAALYLSAYCWGAVLLLAFLPPFSNQFQRQERLTA